jgi:hypothetical protein
MKPFQISLIEESGYLHARAEGPRTPENALKFLGEVYRACVQGGHTSVLLELNFEGPSLDAADIYRVISRGSEEGMRLQRIAYVEDAMDNPDKARFAETVALNRGVNVRLFTDLESASRWLKESPASNG